MQNAQRAKQQAQVELEQAKIRDEAQWEVPQEVKDAWGVLSSTADSRPSDTMHESSYIPFLFSTPTQSSEANSAGRPKGRRTFNAHGQEVMQDVKEPAPAEKGSHNAEREDSTPKRLTRVSGFKVPLSIKHIDGKRAKAKAAQELIREDVKRRPSAPAQPPDSQLNTGFVKPAGVDDSSAIRRNANQKTAAGSLKRDREAGSGDVSKPKRRKNKEVQLID